MQHEPRQGPAARLAQSEQTSTSKPVPEGRNKYEDREVWDENVESNSHQIWGCVGRPACIGLRGAVNGGTAYVVCNGMLRGTAGMEPEIEALYNSREPAQVPVTHSGRL